MKVLGVVIVVLGLVVAWIGITGSQHRVAAIIKGVHLTPTSNSNSTKPSTNTQPGTTFNT